MAKSGDEYGYEGEITKQEVVSAFLQTIQRPLNCLSAEEQLSRRNAIEKLQVCLLKDDGAGSLPPSDVLQAAWDDVILEKVLRCVCDPTEKCRELAINLIRDVAQCLSEVDRTLKDTVTVMAERIGQVEGNLETSEEIRLQLYSVLIQVLLPRCELPTLKIIVDPLHRIVAVTLFDPFHEVQKRACSVIVTMANRDPQVFGNRTGIFLKALVPCLSHSHSRVRIAVFQAIDAMMHCGLSKASVAQQLGPGTKSLAFDHTAAVRELYFASVANWLNYKLISMSDEEIHQSVLDGKIPLFQLPELLPLLLLGITDECLDIATSTYAKLEGIGELYKRFMDHLDNRATLGPGGKRFNTEEEDAKIMEKVMEEERKCQERYEREVRENQQEERCRRCQELSSEVHSDAGDSHPTSSDTTNLQGISLYQSLKSQSGLLEEEMAQAAADSVENKTDSCLQPSNIESRESDYKKALDSDLDQSHVILRRTSPITEVTDSEILDNNSCVSVPSSYLNEVPQPKPENVSYSTDILSDTKLGTIAADSKMDQAVKEGKEENPIAASNVADGLHSLITVSIKLREDHEHGTTTDQSQRLQRHEDDMDEKKGSSTSEITDEGAVTKLLCSDEAGEEILQLPQPYRGRPGAGCRLMVKAFLRPMIEPVLKELKQWTTPTRLCAARVLHTLMILAEFLAKDNLDILIPAFFRAVGDDDVRVAKRVVATIHIVGFHVPPRKWLGLVLQPLGDTKKTQAQRANMLVVTAAFLYGTPRKAMEEKHVVKICDKLYDLEVFGTGHSDIQNQLLSVVANLIQVAGALCKISSFKLFILLLQLQSNGAGDADLHKMSGQVLESLAKELGMESSRELYVQHIYSVLDIVRDFTASDQAVGSWSSSWPLNVFKTFMRSANDTVGPHLESLVPLFVRCLQSDQDPALRISLLQLLGELFEKQELEASWAPLAPQVVAKLLIPSCGVCKTEASRVQYEAMVATGTFLRRGLCSQVHMQEIMQNLGDSGLLPVVATCMDNKNCVDVRRVTAYVVYQILRVAGPILSDEERTTLIEVLARRMDDTSSLIRRAILPAVAMFFTAMPSTFSDSQVRDFLSSLVVHMNDEHPHIQEGVSKAMEACAVTKPGIVEEVLRSGRDHLIVPDSEPTLVH